MPTITKTQAKKFLSQINPNDQIAIIHHDDGDGFCSGIILNNFAKLHGAKTKTFAFNNNDSTLKKLNLKKFNKIIITDIPAKVMQPEIHLIKNIPTLYIDHHEKVKLPKEINYYTTISKGYIPCSRTAYELTKQNLLLALIGTISDSGELYKENDTFIKNSLKQFNLTLKQFQEKIAHPFCDTSIYFHKNLNKAFKILSKISKPEQIKTLEKYSKKIEKEIQKQLLIAKTSKQKFDRINIYFTNPKYPISGIISGIISRKNPNEIHFLLKSQDKKYIGISARDQSKNANLPKLLESLTKNLSYAKTGGHKRASGGQILKKDLKQFIQNIKLLSQT